MSVLPSRQLGGSQRAELQSAMEQQAEEVHAEAGGDKCSALQLILSASDLLEQLLESVLGAEMLPATSRRRSRSRSRSRG